MSYKHVIYNSELVSIFISSLPPEAEGTNIPMTPEMLQQLNLPQRPLGQDLLAENVRHLLDRDALVGLRIHSGATETPFSSEPKSFIPFSNSLFRRRDRAYQTMP